MSKRRPEAVELLEANARERDPTLSLAKCQLTAVPLDVLRLAHDLHALDLSANKLRRLGFAEEDFLTASSADGPEAKDLKMDEERMKRVVGGIRELNLSLNKLQGKDAEGISHLRYWTGLLRLDLSGNGLQRLQADFWGVLPSGLAELKLSYNCLSELPAPPHRDDDNTTSTALLLPPSSLSTLHIDCNGLKTLPATLPLHCPNLTQLLCSDNALKAVPASFVAFRSLTHLDLSGNRISVLPAEPHFYANLAGSLVHMNFKDNALTSLPPALSLLTSLEVLDLRKNRIGDVLTETLEIPSLRVLDLSCNKLKQIELSERLTRLDTLRLEHNQLLSLPSSIGSFTSLLRLYVHDNKMERLPDEIVNLTQLQELDVGRNKLIDVPQALDDLKRLPTLQYYRKSLPDEVIPGLYIGGTESAAHLPALLHRKIKVIVQLVVESEQHFPDQFDYLTYKISDHPTSDLSRYFATCNERIAEALAEGSGALVHCVAGISRSATIVTAFLMHHLKISCDDAMDMLRNARPAIYPNPGFLVQLREYEKELFRSLVNDA